MEQCGRFLKYEFHLWMWIRGEERVLWGRKEGRVVMKERKGSKEEEC